MSNYPVRFYKMRDSRFWFIELLETHLSTYFTVKGLYYIRQHFITTSGLYRHYGQCLGMTKEDGFYEE